MNIILQKDFPPLGSSGEVVTVKDGFARNYLIPQGVALKVDKATLKIIAEKEKVKKLRSEKTVRLAKQFAEDISKISLTIKVQAGEEDKLFGSVTSQDISDLLKEKGVEIDRRKILLEEPIKALGAYQIPIKLHTDVTVNIKLWVIKEQ
jgi:large subunit ribosomal protein L9